MSKVHIYPSRPYAISPSLSIQSEEISLQALCQLPIPVLNSQRKTHSRPYANTITVARDGPEPYPYIPWRKWT